VAARALTRNNRVRVLLASPPSDIRTPEARANFEKVEELHRLYQNDDLTAYDVLVDALLGVGSKGRPRGQYAVMVEAMNASGRPVVSVDIPSGLGSGAAVRPMLTVTFHAIKEGMDQESCGEIVVKDIGIPAEAGLYLGPGELVHYPVPSPDTHKGQNGRLLVVGGGPYTGAPALAGVAAYRIGADLVFVACPERAHDVVMSFSPNLIGLPLPGCRLGEEHIPTLLRYAERTDALLIGPGLGDDPGTLRAIRQLITSCDRPMVLDADALKAMSGQLDLLKGGTGVLTPHHGEASSLLRTTIPSDEGSRQEAAMRLAKESGWTVLMKGKVDMITDGLELRKNRTGNAGMTVGGTGDVLAGITAGLLAKGARPYHAARISAFINGAAGDMAFEKYSYGLTASDLLDRVSQVLRKGLSRIQ
jgi:NAD(P)H-hydrate epimerase